MWYFNVICYRDKGLILKIMLIYIIRDVFWVLTWHGLLLSIECINFYFVDVNIDWSR